MNHRCTPAAFLLLACFAMGGLAQTTEVRGVWATRFEWSSSGAATCRLAIDAIMDSMKAARFNTVFFQIRGQADTLYPSPYEVWSPLIAGSHPGWDPLAYAIAAAHARGLESHA